MFLLLCSSKSLKFVLNFVFLPCRPGPNGPAAGCVSERGRVEPLITGFRPVSGPGPQRPAGYLHRGPKTPAR